MKQYVKISKDDLAALHKLVKEKDAYIEKLEKALESVNRQKQNNEIEK